MESPGSLAKFVDRTTTGNGRGSLFWGRAGVDGAPFRGVTPPTYTDDEFQEKVVKIADPKNGRFDTTDQDQNKKYMAVLDGIANGWFQLIFIERLYDSDKKMVYIEWVEYFMEDGARTTHNPGLEVPHGP